MHIRDRSNLEERKSGAYAPPFPHSHSASLDKKALLDEIQVDLMTQAHAVLECPLIVAFGSLGFDVLLYRVDLRLVLYQLLLYVIQAIVDVAL